MAATSGDGPRLPWRLVAATVYGIILCTLRIYIYIYTYIYEYSYVYMFIEREICAIGGAQIASETCHFPYGRIPLAVNATTALYKNEKQIVPIYYIIRVRAITMREMRVLCSHTSRVYVEIFSPHSFPRPVSRSLLRRRLHKPYVRPNARSHRVTIVFSLRNIFIYY